MAKPNSSAAGSPILEIDGMAATIRLRRPADHNRIDPDDVYVVREHLQRIGSSPGVRGTRMFMPAARFGLHYYPGGLRGYVAALGLTQAKRLFLTAQSVPDTEMLRIGLLTEFVARRSLVAKIAAYVAAIVECEPSAVKSMKAQLNAIAGGDRVAAKSRSAYERSLDSDELKPRLAILSQRRKQASA